MVRTTMNITQHFKALEKDSNNLGAILANQQVSKRWVNATGLAEGTNEALARHNVTMDRQVAELMDRLQLTRVLKGNELILMRVK